MASTQITSAPPTTSSLSTPPGPPPTLADGTAPPLPTLVGTTPNRTTTILKNVAIFGAAGAAIGFGASFLSLPIIGQLAAPILAAIGGAIGITIGAIKGIRDANTNEREYNTRLGATISAGGGLTAPELPLGVMPLRR